MAIVIDATACGANSNSYCTLAEAETYFESRLHKSDWTDATDGDKNISIAWATRLLDELIDWEGYKYTTTQALRWPRGGVTDSDGDLIDEDTIPSFLVNATAEFAMWLISEDRTAESDTAGFKKIKVDVITLEIDKYDQPAQIPLSVLDMLIPYGTSMSSSQTRYLVRQ
jgi:hypothetical protein